MRRGLQAAGQSGRSLRKSCIWFTIGGFRDLRWMFAQLRRRTADPSDDGRIEHRDFESPSPPAP